jgi:hypothetical protein
MITPIQKCTSLPPVDHEDRNLSSSTIQDIHVAQAHEVLNDLRNYRQGDLLRQVLPEGTKAKVSTKTMAKHVAYLSGFLELVKEMTQTAADTMKINGKMADLAVQNATAMQEYNAEISSKTTSALNDYAAEVQDQKKAQETSSIIGWIVTGLVILASLGTLSVAGFVMAACMVAQTLMSTIKDSDGKTVMDKLTDSLGGDKWKAELLMDAIVIVLSCGAGIGAAAAKSAATVSAEVATEAATKAATDAAETGAKDAAESSSKAAAEGAAESAGTAARSAGSAVAEETGSVAAKKTADQLKKEALEKLKQEIVKEVAEAEAKSGSEKALSSRSLQISKEVISEGLKAGAKLGMQISMTVFNPISSIVSDIYYNANVTDKMSDLDKQALRSKADLIGEGFGLATSLLYGFAASNSEMLNGFSAMGSASTLISPARMLLIQKVLQALKCAAVVGQGISCAILASILSHTAETQTEIADLKSETTKINFAIDTMSGVRDQIQKEATKNSGAFFDMLDMMMTASKNAFKLK